MEKIPGPLISFRHTSIWHTPNFSTVIRIIRLEHGTRYTVQWKPALSVQCVNRVADAYDIFSFEKIFLSAESKKEGRFHGTCMFTVYTQVMTLNKNQFNCSH